MFRAHFSDQAKIGQLVPEAVEEETVEGHLELEGAQARVQQLESDEKTHSFAGSVQSVASKAAGLVGTLREFFSREKSEPSEEAVHGIEVGPVQKPIHNTMRYLFGVLDIKALDTVEAFVNAGNIREDIALHFEDRNKRGHTLIEALEHVKNEYVEKQVEVEKRRAYQTGFYDATELHEDTEEARLERQAEIERLTARAEKYNASDRKRLEPILRQIDRIIEQVESLRP